MTVDGNFVKKMNLRYQYPLLTDETQRFAIVGFNPKEIENLLDIDIDFQKIIQIKNWREGGKFNEEIISTINFTFNEELLETESEEEFVRGIVRIAPGVGKTLKEVPDNFDIKISDFEFVLNSDMLQREKSEKIEDFICTICKKFHKSPIGIDIGKEPDSNKSVIFNFSSYKPTINKVEYETILDFDFSKNLEILTNYSFYHNLGENKDEIYKEITKGKPIPPMPSFKQILLFNIFACLRELDYRYLKEYFGGLLILTTDEIIPYYI